MMQSPEGVRLARNVRIGTNSCRIWTCARTSRMSVIVKGSLDIVDCNVVIIGKGNMSQSLPREDQALGVGPEVVRRAGNRPVSQEGLTMVRL